MICFGCGTFLKARKEGLGVKVYDEKSRKWLRECPFCECEDFYSEGDEYLFYST